MKKRKISTYIYYNRKILVKKLVNNNININRKKQRSTNCK